jgi:hypothetical protein
VIDGPLVVVGVIRSNPTPCCYFFDAPIPQWPYQPKQIGGHPPLTHGPNNEYWLVRRENDGWKTVEVSANKLAFPDMLAKEKEWD